jgi:signal transduction histidine kinase
VPGRVATGLGPLRDTVTALHLPVQDALLRTLAVLRVVVLVNAVVIFAVHSSHYDHPGAGWAVMAGLALWTVFAIWQYDTPDRRRGWLFVADLVVAVAAILGSPYVKGPGLNATLPGFWVMGVVLAWAIGWRLVGGLLAGLVVSAADISIRSSFSQQSYGNVFLLVVGGVVVGYLSGVLQQTARDRDLAERDAAAAAERQRLARVVHDGVLQVLALVQRRGPDLGPEGVELGELAADQETRLRALVQQDSRAVPHVGEVDLAELLTGLQTPQVHVATPGTPVRLAAPRGLELVAVVEACLSNVRHHVGPDASAWVLLEDLGDRSVVSVRDEGPGIPPGRLEEALSQGRLGVAQSIRGRMSDLGGTATVSCAPGQGTEWELSVPR